MKNLLSSAYPQGYDRNQDDGGNTWMSTAYLARWTGPVNETDDPYNAHSGVSPVGIPAKKHIQDVYFIPPRQNFADNANIKNAILAYGAVTTDLFMDEQNSTIWNQATGSYYYNGNADQNHMVTIVGWDDNYDRNKFALVPPGNGAFIAENSWGTGWGSSGFFNISYYDTQVGTDDNAVFTAESPQNYDTVYQYDPLGMTEQTYYGNPASGWIANLFTSNGTEALSAISFYTTDTNTTYQAYVFRDPDTASVMSSHGAAWSGSGTFSNAGYHTVPVSPAVYLGTGTAFSVAINLANPSYNAYAAIEYPVPYYSSKATAKANESFVSSNGNSWNDITTLKNNGTYLFPDTNVCVKAFTRTLPVASFTVAPVSGTAPLTVQFTDTSAGSPVSWNWSFGDGNFSTTQNPAYTYQYAGTYAVVLNATNAGGSNISTQSTTIRVRAPPSMPPSPPAGVPGIFVTVKNASGGYLSADTITLSNSTWIDSTTWSGMDYASFSGLSIGSQYMVMVNLSEPGYVNVSGDVIVKGQDQRMINVTLAQLGQMYAPVMGWSENGTAVSGMTTTYTAPTGAVNGNSTAGTKEYLAYTMQVAGNDTVAVGVEIPPRLTVSMTANGNNPMNVTLDGVPLSYQYTTGTFTVDSSAFYTATNATVVAIVPSQSNGKTLNITFKGTLRGDATGDGIITPSDASFTFQCYLRSRNVLPTYDYADVAGTNHQFLPSDASFVFQNYLGTRNL
jgi:PKD repeat protein